MASSDIEIARGATPRCITELAHERLGIPDDALIPYGHHKAKLSLPLVESLAELPDGKLVLVTAISPTPAGEGKTTTAVGLADALNLIGQRTVVALREPSMGLVFGMKGGAAGGAGPRWCRWRTSTCTSPVTSPPSRWHTSCSRRRSTTTCTTATHSASTCGA